MIRGFLYIFLREIRILLKDKKAIVVLLFVPLLYTLFFGYMYKADVVLDVKTAIVNYSPSNISRMITSGFEKTERFDVKHYLEDEEQIQDLMETGEIDVAIVIPKDFTKNVKLGKESNIFLGVDTSNVAISNGAITQAMQIVQTYSKGTVIKKTSAKGLLSNEASGKVMPISTTVHPWYNPGFGYINFIVLGVLSVALQQITLMYAAISFTREKERKQLSELLKFSPISMYVGKFVFYLLAAFFTLAGGCIVAFKALKIPLEGEITSILMLALPFYVSVISLGFLLSIFCKDQGESTQIAMLFAYPTFLLTGFTWPVASMPEILQMVSKALPLTYFVENFRKIALMGIDYEVFKGDLKILWILASINFFISIIMVIANYHASLSSKKKDALEGEKVPNV